MEWIWVEDVRTTKNCLNVFSTLISCGLTNNDVVESRANGIGRGKRPTVCIISLALIGLLGTVSLARKEIRKQKSKESKSQNKKVEKLTTTEIVQVILRELYGKKEAKAQFVFFNELAKRITRWHLVENLSSQDIVTRLNQY